MDPLMNAPAVIAPELVIEWGVAARPLAGQPVSGDAHVVAPFAGGVLVAAIDGLGHGAEAEAAAAAAAAILRAQPDQPVADLLMRCHQVLRRSRGAALSMASFNAERGAMTWIGVGNVEGALFRASPHARPEREALLLRGGIVGYSLPPGRAATLPIAPGDTLILATDGVRSTFKRGSLRDGPLPELAADLLRRHGRETDDALVLLARYIGGP
jgi:negative regulator of sigma-B (phosphoserine phosphatase)